MRVWQRTGKFYRSNEAISTHTPVRVWLFRITYIESGADFNSHTREGVTLNYRYYNSKRDKFQLTHPWGCDGRKYHAVFIISIFQLTHPWGCDRMIILSVSYASIISTHTPVRVWLADKICLERVNRISTHTPVRVWPLHILDRSIIIQFQLTHPWGCDYIRQSPKHGKNNFNSHTREGVTCCWRWA